MHRAVFTYDGQAQAVAAGGRILFNQNTSSTPAISYDGNGGIILARAGDYRIMFNATGVATAADQTISVQLYEGSTIAAGAAATQTATASGDFAALAFNSIVTVKPSPLTGYATLYVGSIGATSFEVANLVVEAV